MAGKKKKKKGGHARPDHNVPRHAAASAGSAPTTAPMAQRSARLVGGHSTTTTRTAGDTSNAAANSLSGRRQEQQQQQQQLGDGQPSTASSTSCGECCTGAHASVVELVAQLRASREASQQLALLEVVSSMAQLSNACRSQLVTGGVMPVLLWWLQNSSEAVQEAVRVVIRDLLPSLTSEMQAASVTSIIPQLVPLVRSRNQDTQYLALQSLEHLSGISTELDQATTASGAVPTITEALHSGHELAQLTAARLLVQLAGVGGISIETALAGAIPVAASVLQCGTPESQLLAATLLQYWVTRAEEEGVSMAATTLDAIPVLLPMLCSGDSTQQQIASALLSVLACNTKAAQMAYEEGAVIRLIQLLCDADQATCFFAADALQCILGKCSEAASLAAAAGAIPPLVMLLATGRGNWHPAASTNSIEGGYPHRLAEILSAGAVSFTSSHLQTMALHSLHSIAAKSCVHCRTAMGAAGATAAVCAAAHSQVKEVRQLAGSTLEHLLAEASNWPGMAAPLMALLRTSTDPQVQRSVLATIASLDDQDPSLRLDVMAAGVIPVLVALLRKQPSPGNATKAMRALIVFMSERAHAAAVAEAGAIPALAQLLQGASKGIVAVAAAKLLSFLVAYTSLHDQVAEVIPQLLQAMRSDEAGVALIAGHCLQLLALAGASSTQQAFKSAAPQWQQWLVADCSEAQRCAAEAIQASLLGCEDDLSGARFWALFRSVRRIDPLTCPSQWRALVEGDTLRCEMSTCLLTGIIQ